MIDLYKIVAQYLPNQNDLKVFPFGSGHIHDTYKVESSAGNFILQKINTGIFKDVKGMSTNIDKVTRFLSEKTTPGGMQVLTVLKSISGHSVFEDEYMNSWRMFHFVDESKSFDRVDSKTIAAEGGRAFSWFLRELNDFPVEELTETIPYFHHAPSRLKQFEEAIKNGNQDRIKQTQTEIDFCLERSHQMLSLQKLADEGEVPKRVTHNDTKVNNVLFDRNNKALCVIDLDTVMPGLVFADFGDAIRTFANTGEEDASDLYTVKMNFDYFEAFAKSFLKETGAILNPIELENLAMAPLYITWEQSIRFLGDFLLNDAYYKTSYSEHNLVRTKAQLALLKNMEDQYERMRATLAQIIRSY